MKTFKPLAKLAQIEEGRLVADVNQALRQAGEGLSEFVEHHKDRATGAKAKLTLALEIKVDTVDDDGDTTFAITSDVKLSLPSRPKTITTALGGGREDPGLFVKTSGSSADPVRQRKLATDDGRAIDPTTGEVLGA